jgi:hypothetical protein
MVQFGPSELIVSLRPDNVAPDQTQPRMMPLPREGPRMKNHPMTKGRKILNKDLATIMKTLAGLYTCKTPCYGDKERRRAWPEESQAAVQRLLRALERQSQPTTSGNAASVGTCPRDGRHM